MEFKSHRCAAAASALLTLIVSLIALLPATIAANADENAGPVRLARFSYLSGAVTWHYGNEASWANAVRNMPLRESAQIWTGDAGRAEIEFDDGSRMRLNSDTLITLQTLYSDEKGEYTEITLNNGTMHLHLKTRFSIYQVNTPYAALKAAGPARCRITASDSCEFEQFYGTSTIEANSGSAVISAGQALYLNDPNAPLQIVGLPHPDGWDTWNADRDVRIDNPDRNAYMPVNIALECDDLEKHGTWHRDRQYGWVWAPTVTVAAWRPYGAGSWTWVPPFGWTWVSADTWGWAPYHYGTWIHAEYGWAWAPGPASQYWSPAVVSFYQVNGGYAWVPLAPREVRYPAEIAVGFRSGSWTSFFSAGAAAVYYPVAGGYCEPRPWSSGFANTQPFARSVTTFSGSTSYFATSGFVPGNARYGGGTFAASQAFSGRGSYQPVPGGQMALFQSGKLVGAPSSGQSAAFGPPGLRPGQASFTPDRMLAARPALPSAAGRPVFRAPLPHSIRQTSTLPGQKLVALNMSRVRPKGIPRDGTSYSTSLRAPTVNSGQGSTRSTSSVSSPTPPQNGSGATTTRETTVHMPPANSTNTAKPTVTQPASTPPASQPSATGSGGVGNRGSGAGGNHGGGSSGGGGSHGGGSSHSGGSSSGGGGGNTKTNKK